MRRVRRDSSIQMINSGPDSIVKKVKRGGGLFGRRRRERYQCESGGRRGIGLGVSMG